MIIAHLYKITNKITDEYYIGKHNGQNQKEYDGKNYWGSGKRIKRQIKKYGYENFNYEVLVIGESSFIFELEKKIVTRELIEEDVLCLNLDIGGEGQHFHCKETREKIKRNKPKVIPWNKGKKGLQVSWRKGKSMPEETKRKIAESNRGQKRSEETKRKLVESHLGKEPGNKGKKLRPEQYEKMVKRSREYWKDKPGFMTGKKHSEATKEKLKLAWEKRKKEKKGLTSGYTFINNSKERKLVSPIQIEKYLKDGWVIGYKF